MKGTVVKSTGSWYEIRDDQGNIHQCKLKGVFKTKDLEVTNPIAVGDRVRIKLESKQHPGIIYEILPRQNYLIRASIKHPEIGHMLAANIDQAVLIATVSYPKTSLGFIDRYLVSAETFRIPVLLAFNKTDLYSRTQWQKLGRLMDTYRSIGYQTVAISCLKDTGMESLSAMLKGKTSLFSGHSGVGKSTILNYLIPEAGQKVNAVSDFSEKGVHTTTFAEMFQLNQDSFIIDTPGIKELGLMEIGDEELSHYFPEMRALIGSCKYYNCSHVHEPKCAIIDAINQTVPESRYLSYLSMLDNQDNRR